MRAYNVNYTLNLEGTTKICGFRYPLTFKEKLNLKLQPVTFFKSGKMVKYDFDGLFFVHDAIPDNFSSLDTNISEYLDQNENDILNPTVRSKIIYGVASVMNKMHQNNAIHRNLSIENIYLNENTEPIIGGFELSKFMENNLKMTMAIGNPYIMAREMFIDGDETYDISVDVYAYAFFLYKMFTNNFEFINLRKCRLGQQYMMRIGRGLGLIKPDGIPDHYWDLIQKCWQANPYERPTFDEIMTILKDDKFALNEFDIKTDLDDLHEYQERIDSQRLKILTLNNLLG